MVKDRTSQTPVMSQNLGARVDLSKEKEEVGVDQEQTKILSAAMDCPVSKLPKYKCIICTCGCTHIHKCISQVLSLNKITTQKSIQDNCGLKWKQGSLHRCLGTHTETEEGRGRGAK